VGVDCPEPLCDHRHRASSRLLDTTTATLAFAEGVDPALPGEVVVSLTPLAGERLWLLFMRDYVCETAPSQDPTVGQLVPRRLDAASSYWVLGGAASWTRQPPRSRSRMPSTLCGWGASSCRSRRLLVLIFDYLDVLNCGLFKFV